MVTLFFGRSRQAAAAAAVPTTAPNSFYAIPSLFATNLSLAWAEGLDCWPAPDTKMGGKCRFSFKSSWATIRIQLLKREIRWLLAFLIKEIYKKEVKVKGTSQNSIAITQISQIYNKQVSLFTTREIRKTGRINTTRSYTLVFIFEIPSTCKIKREPLLLLLLRPCPFWKCRPWCTEFFVKVCSICHTPSAHENVIKDGTAELLCASRSRSAAGHAISWNIHHVSDL